MRCLGAGALVIVALVMGGGWWSAPRDLTIHVPPDLRSGSTRKWWEVPPESVYAFTFYVFQTLNRWPTNGEEDYSRNLHTLSPYLTPSCQAFLRADYDYRRSTGELRQRVRGIYEIPGRGYPTCRQWWSDGSNGLRARLLGQVDPSLLSRLAGWAGFLSRAEVDDSVIRAIASPRQQKLNQGSVYTDYGGQIDKTLPNIVTRATGDVGMAVGAIAAFPAMDVVRQSLPMVLALLKMALVICIPLVLVVGTYDLKTVVTVSVVQFALFFVDFWFQLARWIDSTILDALYGWGFGWNRPHTNFDPLVGLNNAFGDMLLMFVAGTMFLVLPGFWLASLTWVGIRAGHAIQGLSDGSKSAGQAGGKGAGALTGGKLK